MNLARYIVWLTFVPALLVGSMAAQDGHELPPAPSGASQQPVTQPASPASRPATGPPVTEAERAILSGDIRKETAPEQRKQDVVEQGGTTIRVPVNEVSVVFTVTDKHNRYVKTLKRTDFKVVDDERPVEEIRSFRRETDLPLQVGLLIDASNSIRDRFKFEQESAVEFLNQIIRPRYDKAFVVGFDVEPEVTQDFTDDVEALGQGVRALHPGGGTAMYDALYYACRDKLLRSAQSSAVRRAIILVSDGDDNSSHVTREEAIEMALRANVIVYTISTNFPGGGGGDKVLRRIADATGGRAFEPFQLSQVADAFAQIQDDLRSQYELSYRPANFAHDGRYRTIAITAVPKGLKVRSRTGYYAPAE
ncbi:MAG TPA: VWA domain-containing protein [Terriglobales bacterium]|nr:VWA domain-containing protein [Terriglobales bacterium]